MNPSTDAWLPGPEPWSFVWREEPRSWAASVDASPYETGGDPGHRLGEHRTHLVALVDRLYAALAGYDAVTVASLLTHDFRGELSPDLPFGWGRMPYAGRRAMIRDGWGAIATRFRVSADPDRIYGIGDTLIVLGTYRGRSRDTGLRLEAWFAHVWGVANGRFASLRQLTDGAAWREAAGEGDLAPDEAG